MSHHCDSCHDASLFHYAPGGDHTVASGCCVEKDTSLPCSLLWRWYHSLVADHYCLRRWFSNKCTGACIWREAILYVLLPEIFISRLPQYGEIMNAPGGDHLGVELKHNVAFVHQAQSDS